MWKTAVENAGTMAAQAVLKPLRLRIIPSAHSLVHQIMDRAG